MTQEQLHYLALGMIPGVGSVSARTLVSYCGSIEAVLTSSKRQLLKIPGIGPKTAEIITKHRAYEAARQEGKYMIDHEISFVNYLQPEYPKKLKEFPNAPINLFYKGSLPNPDQKIVAIIGTRTPSYYGKQLTAKLVRDLKSLNIATISGLAYGIDAIAHEESIRNGIPSYGVLGHGLKRIYPYQNRKLAEEMKENGGIFSEFHFNTKPDRENFPKRNRIIAALCDALVIVESAKKGGSMITAHLANDYFKDVFAFPGRVNDKKSEGCLRLIKSNKAHLIESADDLKYIMRWEEHKSKHQMAFSFELESDEDQIFQMIKSSGTMTIDEIHYKMKRPLSEIAAILLQLEFKGIINTLPGKKYILVY